MPRRLELVAAAALLALAAAQWPTNIPTIDWKTELEWDTAIWKSGVAYQATVAEGARYVVGNNASLPPQVDIELSNNCVNIISYNDTLFMGWRSAPFHFASNLTKMFIVSSIDGGFTWEWENTIQLGSDVREPHFLVFNDQLIFSFFEAGTDPLAFEPKVLYHIRRNGPASWTDPTPWGQPGEIAWQIGVHNGTAYAGSYIGNHYSITNRPNISVYFNQSQDGWNWSPVDPENPVVYNGGVSEVGWAFDLSGAVYGVLRNEDGDDSGWGSRVVVGPPSDNGLWKKFPANESYPEIYESPRMFRHGNDLYLVARRDPDGPYWNKNLTWLPWELQHDINLASYSLRPHRTSLFRVSQETDDVELVFDIPGCGDTAFPSILRIDKHTYIIVNYTNPTGLCAEWPWILGQVASQGTQIYFLLLTFVPQ